MKRILLTLMLSVLVFFSQISCSKTTENTAELSYEIDHLATSKALWKNGEIVAEGDIYTDIFAPSEPGYRRFLGVTKSGGYLIQTFYKKDDTKHTSPFMVLQQSDVKKWLFTESMLPSINGELTTWYLNGQKITQVSYRNGKPEGTFISWHDNGQKSIEHFFNQNGKTQGTYISWHPNGQKESESQYLDGKQNGESTHWDKEGNPVRRVWYQDDKIIRRQKFFSEEEAADAEVFKNSCPEILTVYSQPVVGCWFRESSSTAGFFYVIYIKDNKAWRDDVFIDGEKLTQQLKVSKYKNELRLTIPDNFLSEEYFDIDPSGTLSLHDSTGKHHLKFESKSKINANLLETVIE